MSLALARTGPVPLKFSTNPVKDSEKEEEENVNLIGNLCVFYVLPVKSKKVKKPHHPPPHLQFKD